MSFDWLEYDYGAPDERASDAVPYDYGAGKNSDPSAIEHTVADPFLDLFEPSRYKVYYGGRGSAKSWHFAQVLLLIAVSKRARILCCREFQSSIAESVHYTLVDQMNRMGLSAWFTVTVNSIYCAATGSEFIFKGLRLHINEIKSMEGIDYVWIEEGQAVSASSWNTLDPTIRRNNSEIWISYNPLNEDDPIHQLFVVKGLPEWDDEGRRYAIVRKVNYRDNPWFPEELNKLRLRHLKDDQDIYAHIWEGMTLQVSDAMVFRNKWEVRDFEAPEGAQLFFGADWGFAQDPTVLLRMFMLDECLYIEYEMFGVGVEIDEIPSFFCGDDVNHPLNPRWSNHHGYPGIPGAARWNIKGDNARPETISYLARAGLNVTAAEKWKGSVEDGITHLRGFRKIYIHSRCKHMQEEALMYRYKVDKQTGLVLPIIVDKHNHGWDAARYALDGYIQRRGEAGLWLQLGQQ